jgi:hypothetical protein
MLWGLLEPNNFSDLYYLEVLQLKISFVFFFCVFFLNFAPKKCCHYCGAFKIVGVCLKKNVRFYTNKSHYDNIT